MKEKLNLNLYIAVSGIIFALVSFAHILRLLTQTTVQFGSFILPMDLSWLGLLLAGGLCVWAVLLLRVRQ